MAGPMASGWGSRVHLPCGNALIHLKAGGTEDSTFVKLPLGFQKFKS